VGQLIKIRGIDVTLRSSRSPFTGLGVLSLDQLKIIEIKSNLLSFNTTITFIGSCDLLDIVECCFKHQQYLLRVINTYFNFEREVSKQRLTFIKCVKFTHVFLGPEANFVTSLPDTPLSRPFSTCFLVVSRKDFLVQ
jgi:hypothetical protein